jgi:hypothetical protein
LSRLCWDGPVEELTATENAQPAILMHSYAVWTLVREALEDSVVVAAGQDICIRRRPPARPASRLADGPVRRGSAGNDGGDPGIVADANRGVV